MRFSVKDSNVFPMPGNSHILHLATISYSLREFVVMLCVAGNHKGKCYIEEVVLGSIDFNKDVFAHCKFIDEDELASDLFEFAEEKGLIDMKKRTEELIDQGRLGWLHGYTGSKK